MKYLSQAGDTIVEVMFAVAIVGITIASAYGVATLSLRNARQAQERGEALKIAESQIESLRAIAADDNAGNRIFDTNAQIFCINGGEPKVVAKNGVIDQIPDLQSEDFTVYSNDCIDGLYHAAIDVTDDGTNLFDYQVTVRWDSLGGDNKNEVKMLYKLFKP